MNNITLFQFESNEIRFVGTADKPEWIAADICKVLDIVNVSDALESLDNDEKGIANTDDGSLTGSQMLTVTEAGLYRLIFKSRKPAAKRMKKWVFSEVLPSIRKTGSYSVAPTPLPQQLPPIRDSIDYAKAVETLKTLADSRLKRLLEDRIVAELSLDRINQSQPLLPAEQQKQYTTATVRAAQLGYGAKQIGSGSALGTFVGKQVPREFKDWQGGYQVWHYEVGKNFDNAIHAYFS